MTGAELDMLGTSVGADPDRGRPALNAKLPRYPLLRILDQRKRQSQAPLDFGDGIAVVAAMERDDEWRFFPGFV